MVITPQSAIILAILVGACAAIAEWLHGRRVQRVARLAFGADGRPAWWVPAAPVCRVMAIAAATWGATMLIALDPRIASDEVPRTASRHVLIALDVSPSMLIEDSGPGREPEKRAVWGGKVAQGVLDRIDMATTRVSLVAFYTAALPVFIETTDKEVVRNALDGLQMYPAFEAGETRLQQGVEAAMDVAKAWMPGTATLVVLSDGDALPASVPARIPPSIADVIVIGVGDPHRSSIVGGHASRQDAASLKQLALRLGGVYHDGNRRHLPSEILDGLTMIQPRLSDGTGLRELALAALTGGAAILAALPVLLGIAGRPWGHARARARAHRAASKPNGPGVGVPS